MELIYKASKNGFSAAAFHSHVDGHSPTLTVVKSKTYNRVFGGYTTLPWNTSLDTIDWQFDPDAKVFSLTDEKVYNASSDEPVIKQDPENGPTFRDFYLGDGFDHPDSSFDMLGTAFGVGSDAIGGDLCCKDDKKEGEVRWNS